MTDQVAGFYIHPQFKLIADPYGYLDTAGYRARTRKYFTLPIRDVLGSTHDSRKLSDLDMLTRFEIASPGDDANQLEILDTYRNEVCFGVSYIQSMILVSEKDLFEKRTYRRCG
jgi:hypothetical protein